MKITAAIMGKPDGLLTRRKIQLEEVELEGPREDEVLLRITSCGVCGTDRGCIRCAASWAAAGPRRISTSP